MFYKDTYSIRLLIRYTRKLNVAVKVLFNRFEPGEGHRYTSHSCRQLQNRALRAWIKIGQNEYNLVLSLRTLNESQNYPQFCISAYGCEWLDR